MHLTLRALAATGLLAVTSWLTACADDSTSAPAITPAASQAPAASTPLGQVGTAGSDGLTVRYLDKDGSITTLPVENFPR